MDTEKLGGNIGDWVIWGVGELELKEREIFCGIGAEGA